MTQGQNGMSPIEAENAANSQFFNKNGSFTGIFIRFSSYADVLTYFYHLDSDQLTITIWVFLLPMPMVSHHIIKVVLSSPTECSCALIYISIATRNIA